MRKKKKTFKQVQKKKKVKTMEPKRIVRQTYFDKNNSEKTTFIVVLNTVI